MTTLSMETKEAPPSSKRWLVKKLHAALMPTIAPSIASSSLSSSSSSVSWLNELPKPIMSIVYTFLPLDVNVRLAMINKVWLSVSKRNESQPVNGSYLIRPHVTINYKDKLSECLKLLMNRAPVSLNIVSARSHDDDIHINDMIHMDRTLRSLEIGSLSTASLSRLSFLTSLTLTNTADDVSLSSCTNLLRLQLGTIDIMLHDFIPLLPVTLTSLSITYAPCGSNELRLIINRLPSLRHLSINLITDEFDEHGLRDIIPLMSKLTHIDRALNNKARLLRMLGFIRLPSLQRMTISDIQPDELIQYLTMAPAITRIDHLTLFPYHRHDGHRQIDYDYGEPGDGELNSMAGKLIDESNLKQLELLTNVASLTHLDLALYLPAPLHYITSLSRCLVSLTLAPPPPHLTFQQLSLLTRLQRLSLEYDGERWDMKDSPFWRKQPDMPPQWQPDNAAINNPHLSFISFNHVNPIHIMPFITSTMAASSTSTSPESSSSGGAGGGGCLHIWRYESVVEDWIDAGLSPNRIVLHDPDDHDCIQRMISLGVTCVRQAYRSIEVARVDCVTMIGSQWDHRDTDDDRQMFAWFRRPLLPIHTVPNRY
jgi:hypothetical protein